jgi:uncharacterized protein (TIGR03083 family)
MDEDLRLREWIAAERRELAAVLTALPAESWNAATLCVGWRVREVVAHMTMPYRYSGRQVMVELLKARGSFNRAADRCARRDTRTRCRPRSSRPACATTPNTRGSHRAAGSPVR